MSQDPVLVTGAAGFIGFSLARRLLENGRAVVGVDSVNSYYDPALKEARLAVLRQFKDFTFHRIDLADRKLTEDLFDAGGFGPVVHLAAQAGVRYSLRKSLCLSRRQSRRFSQRPGRLPPPQNRASRLRIIQLGLRRQHAAAVFGASQCGPPDQPLRRNQEGE